MRTQLIPVMALLALAAGAPAAHGNHVQPNLGIDVTAVDPATRTVEGILHCTSPERAGRPATFTVTPDIEFGQFRPGVRWGIAVDPANVILSTGDMPCRVGSPPAGNGGPVPGGGGGPGAPPGPGPGFGGPGGPGGLGEPQGGAPSFTSGFLNRVWKFEVELDGVASGRLSVTIEKVLNLPKRFRSQDDGLVDEDALVLVGSGVRVSRDGERVSRSELEDARTARIHGKLLPPHKWQEDEDGEPVPTVRAKRIQLP